MQVVDEAIQYAAQYHAGQFRDGDAALPYIVHPVEVVANLRYVGSVADPEVLAAAALHDVLEETSATESSIRIRFGDRIADLVVAVTRREPGPDETEGLDSDQIWELRSKILIEEIRQMPPAAMQIKLADRLSNLREARRTRGPRKYARYRKQTGWLLDAIPRLANPGLWDALKAELD